MNNFTDALVAITQIWTLAKKICMHCSKYKLFVIVFGHRIAQNLR